jgi:hypothetical protein
MSVRGVLNSIKGRRMKKARNDEGGEAWPRERENVKYEEEIKSRASERHG